MADPILSAERLSKRYGSRVAVDELTFEIEVGQIFGFLGHNGAGKSTTIQLLATLLSPSAGVIKIAGLDILQDPLVARRLVGYVPERVQLYERLTTLENLQFFGRLTGASLLDQRIEELFEVLECEHLALRRVGNLSRAERQRVALAQALLHRPILLLLDEPTAGLDPLAIEHLRRLLLKLNQRLGLTIVLGSHLLSEISETCTHIGLLSHGQLIYQDSMPSDLFQQDYDTMLEELYWTLSPVSSSWLH